MPQKHSYSIMQLINYHFHHLNVMQIVKIDKFAFYMDIFENFLKITKQVGFFLLRTGVKSFILADSGISHQVITKETHL